MFKKLLALASVALLSFSVQAAKFTEGDYYKVLDLPQSGNPVVTEFFSFFCPHCNSFEPMIQQLKKTLPDNTKLQKNHVSFMGGSMGPSMSKAMQPLLFSMSKTRWCRYCSTVSTVCKNRLVTTRSCAKSSSTKGSVPRTSMEPSTASRLTPW